MESWDRERARRYLLDFDWEGRNAAVEENIVDGGLPLWLEILQLIPSPAAGGTLLELGSPPFHTTLLVQKLRPYRVVPTAGVVDGRKRITQRLANRVTGDNADFDCRCFDLERDTFPFADDSFDVVLFCEVIEHLLANPVFTLAEIHRVLRPGGSLVLSTPNAASSGHVMRLWLGGNVFDQYHLGSPLRGTRHSHEYTMRELRDLVAGCGFAIDVARGRNLDQIQYTRRTRFLEPLFRLATALAPGVHSDHLFLRATKSGPFRWNFPAELFDQGHLQSYLDVRSAQVVMGENDVPQTSGSWGSLRPIGGRLARGVGAQTCTAHLHVGAGGARTVEITFAAGSAASVTVEIRVEAAGAEPLASISRELEQGGEAVLSIALRSPASPGDVLRVDLRAAPEAFVASLHIVGADSR